MKTNKAIQSEDAPAYQAGPDKATEVGLRLAQSLTESQDAIISQAIKILESRQRAKGFSVTSPKDAEDYLRLQLAPYPYEVFGVLFLDNRHRMIEWREMFRGTIDGASVHPREVVRAAIELNAAAVIFAHNHPSGVADPSKSDLRITERLKDALALIDVRTLDHMIVGEGAVYSFAEAGLL